jgi:predicted DCC family thiol-disulfide oxidoreductase YuxK
MSTLTVFYDGRCGLCQALVGWIGRQRQLVPVICAAKPDDEHDLVVTADTGERWAGDDAWVMVLWALAEFRPWAYRLAEPALRPTARVLFKTLSAYRGPIACALGLSAEGGPDGRG